MDAIKIIVVEMGGADRMLVEALDYLRHESTISFGLTEPQSLDEAELALQEQQDIQIVLIVTADHDIGDALTRIHELRPDVHIVALTIDACPPHLHVRNPNYAELTGIIKSLAATPKSWRNGEGKILKFRARLPVAVEDEDEPPRNLPALAEPAPDASAIEVIDSGLRWVETASRSLLKIWSGRKDETAGFALSWESLERWLGELIRIAEAHAGPAERDFDVLTSKLRSDEGRRTPLAQVADLLQGDTLALKLFLIAMAPDLDIRFHRLFGALHDEFSRRYASLGLACAIVATATEGASPLKIRAEVAALDRLRELGLVSAVGPSSGSAEEPLRTSGLIVDWLLTGRRESLTPGETATLPEAAIALIPAERLKRLKMATQVALAAQGSGAVNALLLTGSAPGWLEIEAAALDPQSLFVTLPAPDADATSRAARLRSQCIAALLTGRRLVINLGDAETLPPAEWRILQAIFTRAGRTPYLVSRNPALQLTELSNDGLAVATLPPPTVGERREVVAAALRQHGGPNESLAEEIADTLPIALYTVPDAITLALAIAADAGRIGKPDRGDWFAGFRRAAGARLPGLARRVEPTPCPSEKEFSCLDAVVLPRTQRGQLEELVKHARHARFVLEEWGFSKLIDGRGVAALFSGESGTGKTSSAHAVASELKTDLYAIELAQVVSKYIGETEKNLDVVFDDAERAGAVLLFDEADALFGKRTGVTDAHDRYANIEVAYLLQRMQRFGGVAILTSNNAENLDPAFTRRLGFRIQFPRPNAADRLTIWEQSIPIELRADRYSLKRIAFALDVTGGTIRQMALHAAVLAAEDGSNIRFEDVVAGARSQLVRLGLFEDIAKLDAIPQEAEAKAA